MLVKDAGDTHIHRRRDCNALLYIWIVLAGDMDIYNSKWTLWHRKVGMRVHVDTIEKQRSVSLGHEPLGKVVETLLLGFVSLAFDFVVRAAALEALLAGVE